MNRLIFALLLSVLGCESRSAPAFERGACEPFGVDTAIEIPESCALDVEGEGQSVRVFAIGPVIRYAEMEDYAAFCKAWDDVVRTEVLPCLANDKPNLLVFPENASLAGAFIGSRGAMGRAESEALPAFISLIGSYGEPILYYSERFPDTGPNQRLVLALTDTLHRAFETFPAIAERYGVYVAVSSDFAPAQRSEDPEDIERLADPDLDSVSSVYVASEGTGYNWGLYFGPDGREIDRVAKSYLVAAEEDLLDLRHGPLTKMRPVELPFARSGMVISKDAWMPGLLHRLDALGANLMLQPEAFSGWGVEEYEGDWLPDIVRQSAWAHTQRHAAFRHTVTSCIKGNLLDLVFDCQSHITQSSALDDTPASFIAQDPYLGLRAVEPWVMEDPGPPMSIDERRALLRDRGERMLPGSGDPLEDAYAGQVIAADLSLPPDGRVPATGDGQSGLLGASILVAEPITAESHQRFPALAADTTSSILAWMEGASGAELVRFFVADGDGTLSEVSLGGTSNVVQRLPRVAAGADRLAVVWEEELGDESSHVRVSTRVDGTWTSMDLTDPAAADAWQPDVAIDPVSGRLFVTWLDLRAGGRPKPWIARSDDGQQWDTLQVDPSNSIVDEPRGDAAFARVAAYDDGVFVAFSDFREFSWDVYLAASSDGAEAFAPAARINPAAIELIPVFDAPPLEAERIHGDVALTVDPAGSPIVAWTDRQDRRYESQVRVWRAGETTRLDDAPDGIDAWRPALAATPDGELLAVWQDLRDGTNRIRFTKANGSPLAPGPSAIADDAATGTHLYAPRVAARGNQTLVAWEDPRSGYARVRLATSD